jgi:16S rRNA processing protein RimM
MIQREELVKIGQFKKPHGVKGEISFSFTNDSFDTCERPFFICELEGIFVPFLLEEYRFNSASTALVKLKNRDSEAQVALLTNKEVYFPKADIRQNASEESFTWDYFIGFTLVDKQTGEIGRVSEIDTTTINILFVVRKGEDEIFIPAVNEWIVSIDEEEKKIYMELPEGLLPGS